MKEIKITKEEALALHKICSERTKSEIESNFPELFYKEKKWEDFGEVSGCFVSTSCSILKFVDDESYRSNMNVNPTYKECEMDIAMCQLRQWRDKANGESIFDWCDWTNLKQEKYCIYRSGDEIVKRCLHSEYEELAFKTRELMDKFFKDHKTLIHTAKGLTFNK